MEKIISYCGLICSECPAYIATLNDDNNARKKVAENWSKMFHAEIKPKDINCSGCLHDGEIIFNYCKVCEIRKCGKGKKVKNCGFCDEYPCEKLTEFLKMVPEAKKVLDQMRLN